jgi:hypothetical protein
MDPSFSNPDTAIASEHDGRPALMTGSTTRNTKTAADAA